MIRNKYVWAITVLGMLGCASLGFGGKAPSSSCSCVIAYSDAYQQCKLFRGDRTAKNACVAQAEAAFSACMATTTDPACLQ